MNTKIKGTLEIPENPDGLGAVQDGDRALFFGFTAYRDVFTQPGYLAIPDDDVQLKQCACCACELLYMKPLLNGITLTPEELQSAVIDSGFTPDSNCKRDATMVLAAIHQAVSFFAGRRKSLSSSAQIIP